MGRIDADQEGTLGYEIGLHALATLCWSCMSDEGLQQESGLPGAKYCRRQHKSGRGRRQHYKVT